MSETLVLRRPLGLSGLAIPRVSLGCGNFGGVGSAPAFFGQGLTQDQAFELMDAAWEFGLTHFDTADAYGGGRSETAIGRWIASRGVRPQLTTKTYNPMRDGADHGLKPERIARRLHLDVRAVRDADDRRPSRGRHSRPRRQHRRAGPQRIIPHGGGHAAAAG